MMRTSILLVAVTTAVLGGTLIASAQVSWGSPDAAQQNSAKKPTHLSTNLCKTISRTNLCKTISRMPPPLNVGAGGSQEPVMKRAAFTLRSGPHAVR